MIFINNRRYSMKRSILAIAAMATLAIPGVALAAGSPPSVPSNVSVSNQTKTTLQLNYTSSSCDPDGDFGLGQGYYEFQVNGVTVGQNIAPDANCSAGKPLNYTIGFGNTGNPPLHCATGYTVRVRAVDAAGHRGSFVSVTGSQGAKTLAC